MSTTKSPDPWKQGFPPGRHYVFVPGVVKPINAGSAERAELIVTAVNALLSGPSKAEKKHADDIDEAVRHFKRWPCVTTINNIRLVLRGIERDICKAKKS